VDLVIILDSCTVDGEGAKTDKAEWRAYEDTHTNTKVLTATSADQVGQMIADRSHALAVDGVDKKINVLIVGHGNSIDGPMITSNGTTPTGPIAGTPLLPTIDLDPDTLVLAKEKQEIITDEIKTAVATATAKDANGNPTGLGKASGHVNTLIFDSCWAAKGPYMQQYYSALRVALGATTIFVPKSFVQTFKGHKAATFRPVGNLIVDPLTGKGVIDPVTNAPKRELAPADWYWEDDSGTITGGSPT
jgi:hypothetical protein